MSGDNNNLHLPEINPDDFGYLSSRDIDGDGNADLIHGVDNDGNAHVFHLDSTGNVTVEEMDTDGDGTFETQREVVDSETTAYTVDTDNDGAADVIAYTDTETGVTMQQDHIDDNGNISESRVDIDGDGVTDVIYKDTSGDGNFNEISYDLDGDGYVNTKMVDTNDDGVIDEIHSDVDNTDGVLETVISANDYAGGLGNIADYTGGQDNPLDNQLDTQLDTDPAEGLDSTGDSYEVDYNDSF